MCGISLLPRTVHRVRRKKGLPKLHYLVVREKEQYYGCVWRYFGKRKESNCAMFFEAVDFIVSRFFQT